MSNWDAMGAGMGAGMGWGWIFGLLMLAGLVTLVVVAVRALSGRRDAPGTPAVSATSGDAGLTRAKQLLAERYARGEISVEQYRDGVRVLEES